MKHNELFVEGSRQDARCHIHQFKSHRSSLYEMEESYHFSQVNVEGLTHCYDVIRDKVNKGHAINNVLENEHHERRSHCVWRRDE